jgi:hypothetical protein
MAQLWHLSSATKPMQQPGQSRYTFLDVRAALPAHRRWPLFEAGESLRAEAFSRSRRSGQWDGTADSPWVNARDAH